MPELFGASWVQEFKRRIDESDEYRRASEKWESPVILAVRAEVQNGVPAPIYVYLDLYHGACREAKLGTALDVDRTPFVFTADRDTWVKIVHGELELLTAVMLRQVHVDKGDLRELLGSVNAMRALVKAAEAASQGYS